MEKFLFSAGGLILVLVCVILFNLIIANVNIRWDATEDNLYSLSDSTKTILEKMEQDVTIKFFYSKGIVNLPVNIKNYAQRVIDFLSEYEFNGNGRINLEIYDPKPDSEEEEWAQKYGIRGINLPTGEAVYFGLVAMAADQEETIPFMDPTREEHLEYDISRIISRIQTSKKSKIGVISSLPLFGSAPNQFAMQNPNQGTQPWLVIAELEKTYDVEQIDANAENLPDGIDLLVMVHPKTISDQLEFAVDQFILRGGKAIVFTDPFCTTDNSPDQSKSSTLNRLFTSWGVKMDTAKALVDYNYATRLRNRNNQIENNPLWISIKPEGFNQDQLITAQLENMLLPLAGTLEKTKDSKVEFIPLIQSSANSNLTETFKLRFGAEAIRRDFKASVETYTLAAMVKGKFQTAFPAGRPAKKDDAKKDDSKEDADKAGNEADTKAMKEAEAAAAIIIVADADLLFDGYYVNRQNFLGFNISKIFNDNLNFLLNASEMLTGTSELIDIRTRGKFERPFLKVQELEEIAQKRWLAREQDLVRKVEETNNKLRELEQSKDSSQQFILSAEQEKEIENFQEEKRRINKELKVVRRNLRKDIDSLGNLIKFINIFLMPLLVALAGIAFAVYKQRKLNNSRSFA